MKLSRLEVYGFKSFARKLDLKLLGGITAIVGPNGCGKTNVVDAIRWVLGEQRPTQIRLDRMEDVIFKGSGTRRPLGMSEVSLTVENDLGVLPVNIPEVTITRRLFRSGESEYMINRKQCRLADINDMLMDTGAGMDSYSVFELSMINSILSDKAEDRRHVFEEAAGITKYKARRKSALNTLLSIKDDLDRLGDIINELNRRVDSLKRQASKASRYRSLKSELKSRTVSMASYEIEKYRKKLSAVSEKLVSVQSSMESIKAKTGIYTSEIESLSTDIVNVEEEMVEITGLYEANVRAISEKESEIARYESRMESLAEMSIRARESEKRNATSLEKLTDNQRECSEKLTNVENSLKKTDMDYSVKTEKFKELETKVNDRTNTHKSLELEYHQIERKITSSDTEIKNLIIRRQDGESRLRDIKVRLEKLGFSLISINEEIALIQEKKLYTEQKKNKLSIEFSSMKKKLADIMKELEFIDTRLLQVREQKAALKAETDFLTEIIQSYEGYSEGVKNAVNSQELRGKVLGVLADLISTDDEYIPAIETALINRLQAIVVATSEDALAGARYLSEEPRGLAVFLPLDGKVNTGSRVSITGEAGVIGPAYEFVRTDDRFMPAVKRLLDRIIIVDTLEKAFELHNRFSDFSFVTLSGEMVGHYGEIHSGCIKKDTGKSSINRLEKLEKLKKAFSEVDSELNNLEKRRAGLSSNCDSLHDLIKDREKEIDNVRMKLNEISSNEAQVLAKREATVDLMNNLQSESVAIKKSFEGFDVKIKELKDKINKFSKIFSSIDERLDKTSNEIKDLKTELNSLRSGMNSLEIERATLKEKRAALIHEIKVLSERKESLTNLSKRALQEIEDAENEILQVGKKKKSAAEYCDEHAKEHDQLEKRKVVAKIRHTDLRSLRSKKEQDLQNIRSEQVELSKKESSLTLEKDEASMIMKNIIQRLSEEYFINVEEIPTADKDPEFDPEDEKLLLGDLRRKIHNLGDVNLAAESDYNEEKNRLDFLVGERDDLIEARDTLMETISKINQVARARFLDTFEKTNSNFQETFREFFDGGVSALELAEGEDPLEANILISARPPGKNIRSINLLSSGERALTAISLLFAIYMVKPSPFCILDEVDAPLDDANIDRFLRVIKEFSKETQFIIVTHNKKTMTQADNLYGITMEEPGLSSMVSVRLSEVDSYSYEDVKSTDVNERVRNETVEV